MFSQMFVNFAGLIRCTLVLLSGLWVVGAAAQTPTHLSQTSKKACEPVMLISNGTAQNTIANTLVGDLLKHLGYQIITVPAASSAEAYDLMRQGLGDIYLSTWAPLDKPDLLPFGLHGQVKTLYANVSGAYTGLATNHFGRILGIKNISELKQFDQVLDFTIYVGQADWRFAQAMQALIDSNIYGLGRFEIQRVHDFDLLQYLQVAHNNQRPLVFFTRSPSVAANRYGGRFLKDTQGFFRQYQKSSTVYTSVRYDFPDDCPNVTRLLMRFEMTADMQNQIMERAWDKDERLATAVRQWAEMHTPLMLQWLSGVKTADGQSARKVLMKQWRGKGEKTRAAPSSAAEEP